MLETIERAKLRDVVADRLRAYITEEMLRPGDRLPTETELAARFGVSRLSLREATKSLEFLGILEAKPGRGLTVGRMNLDKVTECLGFHPALQEADPLVLIDTRVLIETGVLPHVSRRMQKDASIHAGLSEINRELRQTKTLQRFVELDIAFHRSLIEASGLTPLMPFGEVLAIFFQRFRESVKKAEWSSGITIHQRIIDNLQRGNVAEAERELRESIESHKKRIGELG
ncbi:MAG: GntR family transcriptional regulator [Planctomycetales bacterium]